jgi:hypothetical protein
MQLGEFPTVALKVNACWVGPFFVSHSMRSRPSAILGRTPAGTHQSAIVGEVNGSNYFRRPRNATPCPLR